MSISDFSPVQMHRYRFLRRGFQRYIRFLRQYPELDNYLDMGNSLERLQNHLATMDRVFRTNSVHFFDIIFNVYAELLEYVRLNHIMTHMIILMREFDDVEEEEEEEN